MGLTSGTRYYFALTAFDTSGNQSDFDTESVSVSTTIAVPPPDTSSPTVPSGLSASAISDTQINLSWTASADNIGVTGYNIIRDPVHVHDLHATLLHAMGVDHKRLTFRHEGRDYRLTDIAGNVVKPLLA